MDFVKISNQRKLSSSDIKLKIKIENIKSNFVLKKIFDKLDTKIIFNLIKYNKNLK